MNVPNLDPTTPSIYRSKGYIQKYFSEFFDYIDNRWSYINNFSEKLYLYTNKIDNPPTCPICGGYRKFRNFSIGYNEYCSQRCAAIGSRNKRESTCLKRYGVTNPAFSKELLLKKEETNLKRYGVKHVSQNHTIREKQITTMMRLYGTKTYTQTNDYKKYMETHHDEIERKKSDTCLKRYGTSHVFTNKNIYEKTRQTCLERYGFRNYSNTEEFQIRQYATKKKNHSFNSSKIEEDLSSYLDSNKVNYIRQYKSVDYPFVCDFYFPDKDVYLEINASWTHGPHPFNPNNQDDMTLLEEWKRKNNKYYNNAIDCWTRRDPLKVQTAKANNIMLYSVYSNKLEEILNFCEDNNILNRRNI